jgi:hypothetical protein
MQLLLMVYFLQKPNVASLMGLSNIQKYNVALWMFDYEKTINAIDEYVHSSADIAMELTKRFVCCN